MEEIKSNVKLKTVQVLLNKKYNNIFNEMTTISKNIYNSCVFCDKIFNLFKKQIYKDFYNSFELHLGKRIYKEYESLCAQKFYCDIFVKVYKKYYDLYIKNKDLLIKNNNIIYSFIKATIGNNILNSYNTQYYINKIIVGLKNLLTYDETNKKLVFIDVVINIIKSFYNKTYFKTRYDLLNHKPLMFNDSILIDDIKKNNYFFKNKKIEKDEDIVSKSEQYVFKCCVYEVGLNNNKNKLPADIILNIIDRYYNNIKSYYALLAKKTKANKPTFKKEKHNLYYFPSSFKLKNNNIRLALGNNISSQIDKFYNKPIKLINNKNYIMNDNITFRNMDKNKNFIKLNNNGYINKNIKNNYIVESSFCYIKLPKKLQNEKIKLVDIKLYGNSYKVNICYEIKNNIKIKNMIIEKEKPEECISIDTGIKNLMTIYNPTGLQHIIKGNELVSINEFYNKKLAELQSINKTELQLSKFNRLYSLLYERKNKIKGIINNIVNKLVNYYNDKKVFIVGYNENWKNKVALNKNTNRMFYQIPYKEILDKLKNKLLTQGKKLITIEESYTSKSDSLTFEKMNSETKFKGNRKHRGLFISSIGKALNADLNGAINIMRKVFDLKQILGTNIYNPSILCYK